MLKASKEKSYKKILRKELEVRNPLFNSMLAFDHITKDKISIANVNRGIQVFSAFFLLEEKQKAVVENVIISLLRETEQDNKD